MQTATNFEKISHTTELLYRKISMLNLYLCRVQKESAEKGRLKKELYSIRQLIDEMDQELSAM